MNDEELIRKVAEDVMGWKLRDQYYYLPKETDFYMPLYYIGEFDPLTNLNYAFMVVERMRELGLYVTITCGTEVYSAWFAILEGHFKNVSGVVRNKSLTHAICLAALKAVGNG